MSKAREAAVVTTQFIEFTKGVLSRLVEEGVADSETNDAILTILESSQLGFVTMVGLTEIAESFTSGEKVT